MSSDKAPGQQCQLCPGCQLQIVLVTVYQGNSGRGVPAMGHVDLEAQWTKQAKLD